MIKIHIHYTRTLYTSTYTLYFYTGSQHFPFHSILFHATRWISTPSIYTPSPSIMQKRGRGMAMQKEREIKRNKVLLKTFWSMMKKKKENKARKRQPITLPKILKKGEGGKLGVLICLHPHFTTTIHTPAHILISLYRLLSPLDPIFDFATGMEHGCSLHLPTKLHISAIIRSRVKVGNTLPW